jgi:membrane associated rhomboid family serine protease
MSGGVPSVGGASGQQVVPTCYRHPDRETYIRCQRCDRPICPACMNPAPVGYQCPQCVAEGNTEVRQPQTVLGGEVHASGDLVTKILLGINVAVFLLTFIGSQVEERLGLVLLAFYNGTPIGVADGEYYRVITAAFLHTQWWHIGFNMYALWVLGTMLEPVLGRARFTALYLLSALGGSAASLLGLAPNTIAYGASGAVFGLFGALLVVSRRFNRDISGIIAVLLLNVVLGFYFSGIDWRAHLGGFLTGGALALVYAYVPRSQRMLWAVVSGVLVLALVVVVVLSQANDVMVPQVVGR